MRYKLIAFDMDGTLILWESSWRVIHDHFSQRSAGVSNLLAYERGEIDYPEFMRRDIALWRPAPTVEELRGILSSYTLAPKVREVLSEILNRGYQTAIVTGGPDILADMVARNLGIPHVVANGLQADERGKLTGEGIFRVDPRRKDKALSQMASKLGLLLEDCVAVGDSKYDVEFLRRAGLGVAVGGDVELARVADVVIRDFDRFPLLLDYL